MNSHQDDVERDRKLELVREAGRRKLLQEGRFDELRALDAGKVDPYSFLTRQEIDEALGFKPR